MNDFVPPEKPLGYYLKKTGLAILFLFCTGTCLIGGFFIYGVYILASSHETEVQRLTSPDGKLDAILLHSSNMESAWQELYVVPSGLKRQRNSVLVVREDSERAYIDLNWEGDTLHVSSNNSCHLVRYTPKINRAWRTITVEPSFSGTRKEPVKVP